MKEIEWREGRQRKGEGGGGGGGGGGEREEEGRKRMKNGERDIRGKREG